MALPALGDALGPEHYDRLVEHGYHRDFLRVFRLAPEDTAQARAFLRVQVSSGQARLFDPLPPQLIWTGRLLARIVGWPLPRAALVHRDTRLHAHRDTQHPYPCRNLTLLLAEGCEGGHLVLAEERVAVACLDGMVAAFDGQCLHGVTPFALVPGGTRIAATFYSPLPPLEAVGP